MQVYTVTLVNDPDKPPIRRAIAARSGRKASEKVMSIWGLFNIQYRPDYRDNGIVGKFDARRIMPNRPSYAGTVTKNSGLIWNRTTPEIIDYCDNCRWGLEYCTCA